MTESEARVAAPGGLEYTIHIQPGGLSRLGEVCRSAAAVRRWALVADSQVARLYGQRALAALQGADLEADLFPFPAGEWNKNRAAWADLTDALLLAGVGRDAGVVALGGGVTGDLAGFVAATYMRGLPVVQVPTSLLSMLDSSVGGKTGVDTDHGKNLVGVFHHPSAVLIDPECLETLPRHQRAAGAAEGLKTAAILDADLWTWCGDHAARLLDGDADAAATLIARVVALKSDVVGEDPAEHGRRAILNFGHTVGHALETLAQYGILHGEAVAAGMRAEARLGEALGVTESGSAERISARLEAFELDRDWEADPAPRAVWDALRLDKKARDGRPRCVFLETIGQVARDREGNYTFALDPDPAEKLLATALRPANGGRD